MSVCHYVEEVFPQAVNLQRCISQGCDCKIALGAENFKKSISCATGACCCRGVWGHPPHNFFCFLDAKWCILRPF